MFSTSPQPQIASFLSCVLPDSATVAAVHCRLALAATVDPAGVFVLVPHRRTSQRRSTHRRSRISSGSFRVAAVGGFSARCFKQIWKIGKVLSCPHGISCDCSSTVDFLLSPGKIFCLVSTLFGLKTTDNLYEFKYLYPNQTFYKFPQQNCLFIFSPFF